MAITQNELENVIDIKRSSFLNQFEMQIDDSLREENQIKNYYYVSCPVKGIPITDDLERDLAARYVKAGWRHVYYGETNYNRIALLLSSTDYVDGDHISSIITKNNMKEYKEDDQL
jgi:hypothetical protein